MSLLRRLNIKKATSLQVSAETSSKPIKHSTNYLLAREMTNEFYLQSILSAKTSGIHVSFLITMLAVVTMQNLLHADEQSAAEKRSASIIAEGISSNPGAVNATTGTANKLARQTNHPQPAGTVLKAHKRCTFLRWRVETKE